MNQRTICSYYERGMREKEIAETYNIPVDLVKSILEQYGVGRDAFAMYNKPREQWFRPLPKRSRHRDHTNLNRQ